MFPLRRMHILFPLLAPALLAGCGGSGGTGSGGTPSPTRTIATLASSQSGGLDALFLSAGTLVFADYNEGGIFRVPAEGGDVTGLHWTGGGSAGHLIAAAGKVFFLATVTAGGLSSIPDNVEGITPLGGTYGRKVDMSASLGRMFWCEGPTVFSAPVTRKSADAVSVFFQGGPGTVVRIAVEGSAVFVSEAPGGRISRIDLDTGDVTTLVSSLGAGSGSIALVVTGNYLYALADNRNVHRIDKSSGTTTLIASHYMYFGGIRSDAGGVYWWEHDAVDLRLRRYADGSGEIDNLVTIPMNSDYLQADAFQFLCDGAHVYWITSISDIQVRRLSTTVPGSAPEQVAVLDPLPLEVRYLYPSFIAADDSDLYWMSRGANAFIRLPKSGGTPVIVTRSFMGGSFAFLDNAVLVGDMSGIFRISKQGQPVPASEWSLPYDSSSIPVEATFDGDTIFWAVQNFYTSGHPETDFDLYSIPSTGGPVQVLANIPGDVVRLCPFADNLFLVRNNSVAGESPTGSVISTVPKGGGPELPIFGIEGAVPADLAVLDDKIYVTMDDGIYVFDRGRGTLSLLAPGWGVNRMYLDGSHIYWTEFRAGAGAVRRIPLSGGPVQFLYDGLPCFRITGDAQRIYWTAGSKLLSTTK